MLLEIEEESAKAPKRGNIIRNKIDAAYISHAGLFGKLMRPMEASHAQQQDAAGAVTQRLRRSRRRMQSQ
ncbi:hypothetical protein [Aureimonas altamirensis]|uniref:hypothetical protein n=1 Tax=Aureimonas altamirensis TaxID=370622 RepID=UPI000A4FD71C|nr:hypothetical protein [Aureimonas altamirensis]